jgi:hypothetical protein
VDKFLGLLACKIILCPFPKIWYYAEVSKMWHCLLKTSWKQPIVWRWGGEKEKKLKVFYIHGLQLVSSCRSKCISRRFAMNLQYCGRMAAKYNIVRWATWHQNTNIGAQIHISWHKKQNSSLMANNRLMDLIFYILDYLLTRNSHTTIVNFA